MPDAGIVNGGTTGGVVAILLIAVKEIGMKWLGRNRGYATKKDVQEELRGHEEKEALKVQAGTQDVKVKIFEHQKECSALLRADMKDFQVSTTLLFSQFQENNRDSLARIHNRIDSVLDKLAENGNGKRGKRE